MEAIRIKLDGCESIEERECVAVDCWYDPHFRHWVLYPVDAEGNQLEEARYGFGKREAMQMKSAMEAGLIGQVF